MTTAVSDKSISFGSDAAVRAIISGNKTQTRTIVTPQPEHRGEVHGEPAWFWQSPLYDNGDGADCIHTQASALKRLMPLGCPYGKVGDLLWLKETFIVGYPTGEHPGRWSCLKPSGEKAEKLRRAFYRADSNDPPDGPQRPWEPADEMERWASRIKLEVTHIRVERLQEISVDDAIAEGIRSDVIPKCGDHPDLVCYVAEPDDNHAYVTPVEAFAKSWDHLNADRGYGWDANPWVWVVEFKLAEVSA